MRGMSYAAAFCGGALTISMSRRMSGGTGQAVRTRPRHGEEGGRDRNRAKSTHGSSCGNGECKSGEGGCQTRLCEFLRASSERRVASSGREYTERVCRAASLLQHQQTTWKVFAV